VQIICTVNNLLRLSLYLDVKLNITTVTGTMMNESAGTVVSPIASKSSLKVVGLSPMQSFNELPPLPVEYADGTFTTMDRNIARPLEEFSERTHDQLPAVESHKTNVASNPSFETTRRTSRRKILMLIAAAVVFASVCITLGVVIGRDEVENESENNDLPDVSIPDTELPDVNVNDYDSPTAAPVSSTIDSRNPNSTLVIGRTPSRLENVKAFVSTNGWSSLESTLDEDSPQYKASLWYADFDPLNMELQNTEVVRNRYALAVLYFAFDGPHWSYNLNWMTSYDASCEWNDIWESTSGTPVIVGAVCNGESIHRILLPSMNLRGSIPPEISLLSGLTTLDLYGNDITGTVPSSIAKLPLLTDLILHDNSLTGTFPSWISTMTNLQHIDFARNSFHGEIPSILGQLPQLASLNLENNHFNGTINRLMGVNSFKYLRLGNNNITGELSTDLLESWPVIEELDVSSNQLIGILPNNLFDMAPLRIIDLHDNTFDGSIPISTTAESSLEFLSLSQNRLSGPVTSSISLLSKLHHLDLSLNLLTGTIPLEIENLYLLKYLFLAFNPKFTAGTIPKSWDSLSELVDLSLQGTNRNGTIPGELGLLPKLVMLDLAGNQLTGEIPDDLGSLSNLTFLFLKDNKLIGEIPSSFGKLTRLNTVVLDKNNLSGGSSNVCTSQNSELEVFVSDCEEIACEKSCCSQCCGSSNADNNDDSCNVKWFSRKFHKSFLRLKIPPDRFL
jgi:Leucine-rich repeat (LRR) protein